MIGLIWHNPGVVSPSEALLCRMGEGAMGTPWESLDVVHHYLLRTCMSVAFLSFSTSSLGADWARVYRKDSHGRQAGISSRPMASACLAALNKPLSIRIWEGHNATIHQRRWRHSAHRLVPLGVETRLVKTCWAHLPSWLGNCLLIDIDARIEWDTSGSGRLHHRCHW